jgi:DNA-binding response OmpR family regulator/anti-sigma regulatory factor (Ser/Thr protein kinase)
MNASSTSKRRDILIIDDTPDNLRFLSDLLGKAGYTVRKVISGELGLEAARLQLPDLILLDIKMPGLSGYNVCDQLKRDERTQHIPVIFLSAMDEELDKVMAFEAGAVDYITKPFQVVEVLARIENHLQVSQLRQTLQQQNLRLQQTIEQLSSAEIALETLNQDLEAQIVERTAQLQTENKQLLTLRAELQQALDRERNAHAFRTQMLTNMTQKLRNDLTTINTAVEKLISTNKERSSKETKSVQMIFDCTLSMNRLLQDALPLPEEKLETTALDLTRFCRTFVERWKLPDMSRYQLAFVTWGKSPGLLQLDESRLQQILSHLIANAVSYSPQGGTILFQLVYEATQVNIQIRDEGIGIPTAELERVFEQGYRASNAAQLAPSTGLGLTVAKQVAEQLGGNLSIHSEINRGTTVTFTIPLTSLGLE